MRTKGTNMSVAGAILMSWWVGVTLVGGQSPPSISLTHLQTIKAPGESAEIVQYCGAQKLLLATNPVEGTLDVFSVDSLDPVRVSFLNLDAGKPGAQGLNVGGEVTSVAVHPALPIAMLAVLGEGAGRVVGVDLRPKTRGRILLDQPAGNHPDSIAISPNGKWALVANEAEDDPTTPGSIWALDLAGLSPDRKKDDARLPVVEIEGLGAMVRAPIGEIEPEFVAIDPQSRFAAVSCQENDAVVLIDLRKDRPSLAGIIRLPKGAEPDGVSILDNVPGPDGHGGCLIGIAEEGKKGRTGNATCFWWLSTDDLAGSARMLSRVDVCPLADPARPKRRFDPEGVVLARLGERLLSLVVVERGHCVLCLDVTELSKPVLLAKCKTAKRPEGIVVVPHAHDLIVITGDEGKEGPGGISILRLRAEVAEK
ncbi:MAG: hypothetical protein JXQ73_06520 [Phycisphaerae bacterium]|nr:hypothetical protein [Phycisphaerae bacterium]